MKKSKQKPAQKRKFKASAQQPAHAPERPDRRRVLRSLAQGGLVTAGAAGVGIWGVSSFRAHAAEHDLSRIGQGQPVVVQIHDPTCSMCTALQRQTRRALRCNFAEEPVYLVANIRSDEGAAFATRHRVPHVTLMIMDGRGTIQEVLNGVRQRDELKSIFEGHFGTDV